MATTLTHAIVKVLYTFDGESRTNCLARCPQPLNIQTAHLDSATQIGIIELRTCIEAIVAASPELVAQLGHDYTVYAYDYSEYETPLVGQGMLSWVLASASATPLAPAQQSRTMVTGRVCRNVLGLFSEGSKETLEVKLRLVPVPTCLQSEYLKSMEKYRNAQTVTANGFDAAAWTAFLRANPVFNASTCTPEYRELAPAASEGNSFYDLPASATINSRSHAKSHPSQQQRCTSAIGSRPNSRTGRQTLVPSNPPPFQLDNSPPHESAQDVDGPLDLEAQPSKKRARIVKTAWHGPSVFEDQSAPLRVTASAAASIRGQRPSISHPSASDIAAGDLSQRPPTPMPGNTQLLRRPVARSSSSLNRELPANRTTAYESPYSQNQDMTDAPSVYSPEACSASANSTPADIPSSPPIMRGALSPTPSSPAFPAPRNHLDSGFGSGTMDECFDEDEDEMRPLDEEDIKIAAKYSRRENNVQSGLSIMMEYPGDPELLPKTTSQHSARTRPQHQISPSASPKLAPLQAAPPRDSTRQYTRRQSTNSTTDADNSASGEARLRSESFSIEQQADATHATALKSGGSGIKRKSFILEKLAASIAEGKMPPFCKNCGEVGPPTWRKAYAKIELGSPDEIKLQVGEEAITAFEVVSRDEQGRITSYRILKKQVELGERKDYEELQLCNRKFLLGCSQVMDEYSCLYLACGIWLWKFKSMRPPEKWTKLEKDNSGPKKRTYKKKVPSTKRTQSDLGALQTTSMDGGETGGADETTIPSGENARSGTQHRQRAVSIDGTGNLSNLNKTMAVAALRKAVQSSPSRFPGSKLSPINLEDEAPSPQSTCRLLFPSPRKPGEVKSLDSDADACASPSVSTKSSNKENQPPGDSSRKNDTDRVDDLFADSTSESKPPSTPKARSSELLASGPPKTPVSSRKRRTGVSATPTRSSARLRAMAAAELTPFSAQLSQLLADSNTTPTRGMAGVAFHEADMFGFSDFDAGGFGSMDMGSDLDFGMGVDMAIAGLESEGAGWPSVDA